MFSASTIRKDFPLLKRKIHNKHIVYLDSTATSLKPQYVIDKENEYNTKYTANIFRGIYKISEEATAEYEEVRKKVARFINAKNSDETEEMSVIKTSEIAIKSKVSTNWSSLKKITSSLFPFS